jgi:hypothetical protein
MTPRHFLSIESHCNWIADADSGFFLLGVSERKRQFAETLCKGDYIVTYVKSRGFADVRCVTGDCLVPLMGRVAYDEPFTHGLETKPIAVLHPNYHIPAEPLEDRLAFVAERANWKHCLQHSLRRITQEDGLLLVPLIVATGKTERIALIRNRSGYRDRSQFAYV